MPALSHLITTISENCQLKFLKILSVIYHKLFDHKDCLSKYHIIKLV